MSDATDVANKAMDLVTQAANKLSEALHQYGPQAADFGLQVGRVASVQELVWGGASLIVFIGICINQYLSIRYILKIDFENKKTETQQGIAMGWGVLSLFLSIIIGIGTLLSIWSHLFNAYAWIGLWHPEVFLAAKALNL